VWICLQIRVPECQIVHVLCTGWVARMWAVTAQVLDGLTSDVFAKFSFILAVPNLGK
jgi:hypothetical protein